MKQSLVFDLFKAFDIFRAVTNRIFVFSEKTYIRWYLEIGAHMRGNLWNLICYRQLISSRADTNMIFVFAEKNLYMMVFRNRCAGKEQSLVFDVFKAFGEIENSHK